MYTYPWYHWITFFYIYCFCGWIFESTYVSLKEHRLINRGFLRLPLLPLYGTGAVMMLWVSLPVRDNLILVYIFGVIATTILEYITGYIMERLFKMKYWDYSDQRFNFQGYICLSSSIAWGFLTIFMTEVIHRPIADFVLHMNLTLEIVLICIVSIAFVIDTVKSTKEALALGQALEAMTRLKAEAEEMQVQLALLRAETSQKMEELYQDASDRMADLKYDTSLRVAELKNETALRVAELREETASMLEYLQDKAVLRTAETAQKIADYAEHKKRQDSLSERLRSAIENRRKLSHHMSFYRKGILRGNPTASSAKFAEALKELRSILEHPDDSADI